MHVLKVNADLPASVADPAEQKLCLRVSKQDNELNKCLDVLLNELILIYHSWRVSTTLFLFCGSVVIMCFYGCVLLFCPNMMRGLSAWWTGWGEWGSPTVLSFPFPRCPSPATAYLFLVFVCHVGAALLLCCSTFRPPTNQPKLRECPLVAFMALGCVEKHAPCAQSCSSFHPRAADKDGEADCLQLWMSSTGFFSPERRRQGKFQPFRRLFGKKKKEREVKGELDGLKASFGTVDVCAGLVSDDDGSSPSLR